MVRTCRPAIPPRIGAASCAASMTRHSRSSPTIQMLLSTSKSSPSIENVPCVTTWSKPASEGAELASVAIPPSVGHRRPRLPPVAGSDNRIDTATVLFTDLVGSTALRSRIGEEAADDLRVKHDTLISNAIVVNRGLVVKHTGDGVMATFSAAVDAVAAAVGIQQAVDDHNRRSADERMEVRVGISVGDVTFDGDDCFGLPVIEAQRLEAAADGSQILCAEIVRHLACGRGGYEFVTVGDLDLKGIPDPVPAVEVRWEPVVQVAMPRETPLPSVLAAPRGFDLAGRQTELDAL